MIHKPARVLDANATRRTPGARVYGPTPYTATEAVSACQPALLTRNAELREALSKPSEDCNPLYGGGRC